MGRAMFVGTLVVAASMALPVQAAAYVGPGAGLAIIGAAIAFVGGIFVAVAGFVWYPIKRLLKGRQRGESDVAQEEQSTG